MTSRKIKVGDEVNVKHEHSYKMLTIRSYKVYQVEAIHEDGTFSLKGYSERFPAELFEKWRFKK